MRCFFSKNKPTKRVARKKSKWGSALCLSIRYRILLCVVSYFSFWWGWGLERGVHFRTGYSVLLFCPFLFSYLVFLVFVLGDHPRSSLGAVLILFRDAAGAGQTQIWARLLSQCTQGSGRLQGALAGIEQHTLTVEQLVKCNCANSTNQCMSSVD